MKLTAANWTVRSIPLHSEAVKMVEAFHYAKGAANTSTYRHGLYNVNSEELHGVALWIPPTKTAAQSVAGDDWRRVLCLTRLVVDPGVPSNGASFLLGRSMKMIDRERWTVLLTYADTGHGHTGAIYKATNWTSLGETPAGDVWVDPEGRQCGRKRGGKTLTRDQMIALGCVQLPLAPKIKFVHRAGQK